MIDGTGKAPIADGAVVVVGDRFARVGRRADLPDEWKKDAGEVTVVDAGAGTILPGIVDAHCHISYGEPRSEEDLAMLIDSAEWRAILATYNARKVLRAGVTSASDPAAVYQVPIAVRDPIKARLVDGPRFSFARPEITTHQGLGDAFPSWIPNSPGNPNWPRAQPGRDPGNGSAPGQRHRRLREGRGVWRRDHQLLLSAGGLR